VQQQQPSMGNYNKKRSKNNNKDGRQNHFQPNVSRRMPPIMDEYADFSGQMMQPQQFQPQQPEYLAVQHHGSFKSGSHENHHHHQHQHHQHHQHNNQRSLGNSRVANRVQRPLLSQTNTSQMPDEYMTSEFWESENGPKPMSKSALSFLSRRKKSPSFRKSATPTDRRSSMFSNAPQRRMIHAIDSPPPPYFHGNIDELEVNDRLWQNGMIEGMFLVTEVHNNREYRLSVVREDKVEHYKIKRSVGDDGTLGYHFILNDNVRLWLACCVDEVVAAILTGPELRFLISGSPNQMLMVALGIDGQAHFLQGIMQHSTGLLDPRVHMTPNGKVARLGNVLDAAGPNLSFPKL